MNFRLSAISYQPSALARAALCALSLFCAGSAVASPVTNFARVTVSTGYDAAATTIILATGHGAKLPSTSGGASFPLVWWNATDYPDPTDDPFAEIVNVTTRAGDTLTVIRGYDGTTATTKNTLLKTYKMMLAVTRTLWEQANPPDRLGLNTFPDLPTALTRIGNANKTLSIFAATTVTGSMTVPNTLTLDFTLPGKIVCSTAGVVITINGPLLAGAQQVFELSGGCRVALPPGGVVLTVWWGSKGDGTSDDYAPVQAAWTAGSTVLMPCKTHAIGSTLTALNINHFHVAGCGGAGGGPTDKTVFKWIGAANGTLFKFTGVRDSIFERFVLTVGAAPSTLATVVDFDPTGRLQAETNNVWRDIGVVQRGGATTPDGSLDIGFRISRSTSPGNVDSFIFDNVSIAGCSTAGFSFEHAQSKGHRITGGNVTFCTRGYTNKLNGSTGGAFVGRDLQVGSNTVADFDLTAAQSERFTLDGVLMESSARLLTITGSVPVPIHIKGCSTAGAAGTLHADGQVIQIGTATTGGPTGPVTIEGCQFHAGYGSAATIGLSTSNDGVLISKGNLYNNLSPWVDNGGQTKVLTEGDHLCSNVACSPIVPAIPHDSTQTDVVNTVTPTVVSTVAIPGMVIGWRGTVRVTVIGDFLNNTGSAQNQPRILIKHGTTVVLDYPATTSMAASATRYPWQAEVLVTTRGNWSLPESTGTLWFGTANVSGVAAAPLVNVASYTAVGPDTRVATNITVELTNAVANANYSTRKNEVRVEAF